MMLVFEVNFDIFKKKVGLVKIVCYNILTIGINIIQSYICIISNLVFPFITYLFLLKDFLRNENNFLLRFYFILFYFLGGFSTHFTTILS
jgi:hypothetical protein